jgi:uncharacterized protein
MLAAPLLRVRTRKGMIVPLFCTMEEELGLAERMIEEFKTSWKNRERKSVLDSRIAALESSYSIGDYKLVRGFYALLERRSAFATEGVVSRGDSSNGKNAVSSSVSIDPVQLRRMLFEESSRQGFALTELERMEIINVAATKLHLSANAVLKAMWSDLEHNMVLDQFDAIDAKTLVGWYNLSLLQTLLFSCTKLEFRVSGGTTWKHVLRNVKRLGLMYYLQQKQQKGNDDDDGGGGGSIVCSLEGPLSLFKLTDRYGTSLAKLIPSIIFSKAEWHIDAWILRKTMEGGKKIYEFKISETEVPPLLSDPFYIDHEQKRSSYFDSTVEEKFACRFQEVVDPLSTGWKLIREPDPLIVSGGVAFIPDFMFEKYGKRVYLEIVGFWTPEYLERKLQKLRDIFESENSDRRSSSDKDLFIAVDEDLASSVKAMTTKSSSSSSFLIPKDRLIFYKNGTVPVRSIFEYLKSIDKEVIERNVNDPNLKVEFDYSKDIISISEIAQKHNLPAEAALRIAMRDYGDRYISIAGHHHHDYYLISKSKAQELESLLDKNTVSRFTDACLLLSQSGIPESCHAELISKLGYDVLWQSIDPSNAVMKKRERRASN